MLEFYIIGCMVAVILMVEVERLEPEDIKIGYMIPVVYYTLMFIIYAISILLSWIVVIMLVSDYRRIKQKGN